MDRDDLKEEYFLWLCKFVGCNKRRKLLRYLHSIDFAYTIAMDGNRYEDGIDLRYRFGEEEHYPDKYIAAWLDDAQCSVLEMMVALADRLEVHIAGDPEFGDRTPRWFEDMLRSMDLWYMTDDCFDRDVARYAINRMIDRQYNRNGAGGLFTLRRPAKDMRRLEIWYQAMEYMNEVLKIGGEK